MPYNQPLLFDLVNRKAPKNYKKIGWDKTKWQCYEISYFRYLIFLFKSFFHITAALDLEIQLLTIKDILAGKFREQPLRNRQAA